MLIDLSIIDEGEIERKVDLVASMLRGKKIIVAFSGGVDSTTLAAIAKEVSSKLLLIMQVGDSVASGEKELAEIVSSSLDIPIKFIQYNEFEENSSYAQNPPNRCYFCKWILHEKLEKIRQTLGYDVVINGTNFSDLKGHRPGYKAIVEFGVMSPFVKAKMTKIEIRYVAKKKGLGVWNKPATPCLASRVKTGIPINSQLLNKINKAESFIKTHFQVDILRVRLLENNVGSIEVEKSNISLIKENLDKIKSRLKQIGFSDVIVDPDGYRPYNPKVR